MAISFMSITRLSFHQVCLYLSRRRVCWLCSDEANHVS
jgi:hypothetical protein